MKISENTVKLLHPSRFPGMSPKMAAIMGFILETRYTDPEITGVDITSDGFAFCSTSDDPFGNDMIGSYKELAFNVSSLLRAASIEPEQKRAVATTLRHKITDWRTN